jgi:hypothetical protein
MIRHERKKKRTVKNGKRRMKDIVMSVIEQMKEGFIENVKKFNDAKKDRVSVFENEEKEKM